MHQNELQHHGVKGMKWGVRKKREYGMSKRQLKKQIRNSGTDNLDKVVKQWSSEKLNNQRYRQLGEQSNKIAKEIKKSEEADYRRDPLLESVSKKTFDLYKKHDEIDKQMREIEINIGRKYLHRFDDARLKDIGYSGTIEKGRQMLEAYGKNFTVRADGTIRSGLGIGPKDFIYDYDDHYVRPHNM